MVIFPPRNLPSDSEQWGREVESRLQLAKKNQGSVKGSLSNMERATSGQLGSTEIQVEELLNQVTQTLSPGAFSVSGSLNAEPYNRATLSLTFPPIPGTRSAFFTVGGIVGNTLAFSTPVILVRYQGEVIIRQTPLPSGNSDSDPSESLGRGTFSGFSRVTALSDTPVTFQIELIRRGAGFSTVTLSDIQASLTRSGSL